MTARLVAAVLLAIAIGDGIAGWVGYGSGVGVLVAAASSCTGFAVLWLSRSLHSRCQCSSGACLASLVIVDPDDPFGAKDGEL
jgi:hypothetical protein